MSQKLAWALPAVFVSSSFCGTASAVIQRIAEPDFTAAAPEITFSERPLGTNNPVYNFSNVPGLGDVQVSFRGHFQGQTTTGTSVVTLADRTPSAPLVLDLNSPNTTIVNDGSAPRSPVLSGTPTFNGPISILFSRPVAGVGLRGGFFNAVNGTTIEAYDSNGTPLGAVTNNQTGIEFFGLRDSSGQSIIRGISFYITGNEPAGFAIDDVRFGSGEAVPEPTAIGMILLGGGGLLLRRRRECQR